jgi:hypothetical protein
MLKFIGMFLQIKENLKLSLIIALFFFGYLFAIQKMTN